MTIRPTGKEMDAATLAPHLPVSDDLQGKLVPHEPCGKCGCTVYIPGAVWQMGWLSHWFFYTCDHGPKDERWRVKWQDLTPEQQEDLARVSATAAIRVKNWSQPDRGAIT